MHLVKHTIGKTLGNEWGEGELCLSLRSFVLPFQLGFKGRKTLIVLFL